MAATATAFGLDVHSEQPLLLLEGTHAAATGRELRLAVVADPEAESGWPAGAELVCDQREPGGAINFRIEADPESGYMVWGPSYGRHVLAPDGGRARCFSQGLPDPTWQRLLIAQVLPFAAVLRGLEVLHASAVVHDTGAVALLGPSRAGKTSLSLALCERGATFLADDVLAVERAGDELLGHPGSPVAGVDHAEAARRELGGAAREQAAEREPGAGHEQGGAAREHRGAIRAQPLATNARERLVRVRAAAQPAPLAALLLLERRRDGPRRPRFEPLASAAPLLGATFNSVLTTGTRLQRLLEICALAAQRRVERVLAGPAVDASQLADAVLERLDGRA